jgi:hypothetical protein
MLASFVLKASSSYTTNFENMKKLFLAGSMLAALNFAQATTIDAPSALIGNNGLNGNYAYSWSVPVAAQANQTITSATITFSGVFFKGGKGKDISVDLGSFLSPTSGGLSSIKDKNAIGDAFNANIVADKAINIGTTIFTSKTSKKAPQTLSYTFTGAQLDALNSYINSGNWGFEIDPDGKFSVGGISFSYTSEINSAKPVAIVATVTDSITTAGLLGATLLVLVIARRKFCFN